MAVVANAAPLATEPDRGELATADQWQNYALVPANSQLGTSALQLPSNFKFPDQASDNAVFGIDVSHYSGDLAWPTIAAQKVSFAYVKATQGTHYVDPKFGENWNGLASLSGATAAPVKPILRGAYHFLSADDNPTMQAVNFLYHVGLYGAGDPLAARDLPPCIDVEADLEKDSSGVWHDRWDDPSHTPEDIAQRIQTYANLVALVTGMKPIIYTSANWWNAHLKDAGSAALGGYKIWIAQYQTNTPRPISGLTYSLWQFSQSAKIAGVPAPAVDANIYRGTPDAFAAEFGNGAAPANTASATGAKSAPNG
jgi:lysozyme